MKKFFAFLLAATAIIAVGCNKEEGTEVETKGDAIPATQSTIVGKWFNPNYLAESQPDFDFQANGSVTGSYEGSWFFAQNGVLCIDTKDWQGNDRTLYVLAYTMYNGTVLIMRFDVPNLTPEGNVAWDNGKGYVEIFFKNGTCDANNNADIIGTWQNVDTWEYTNDAGETVTESSINGKMIIGKKDIEFFVAPWQTTYYGEYTYNHGLIVPKFTKLVDHREGKEYDVDSEDVMNEPFPFIGNDKEAYGYVMEARGAWERVK